MTTITFDKVHEYAILRAGRNTQDAAAKLADYPDIAALLNMRLRECWEYAQWDFLKVTAKHEFPDETTLIETEVSTGGVDVNYIEIEGDGSGTESNTLAYKFLEVEDDKTVIAVYSKDPREDENAPQLRTHFCEAGRLRLEAGAPTEVWYQYIPPAPDWIADDPVPEVYEVFRHAAVELTVADLFSQDSNNSEEKVNRAEARGYRQLDNIARRHAIMHTQPTLQVRSARRC